jgi:hypothetical protein
LAGDSYELALKRRGNTLTKYISKKLNVSIKLVYGKPCKDADGQTVCSREIIIVYWNKSDWEWLREVIVHECAHRYDCSIRGVMHHNPKYEHDENYWRCYKDVLDIVTNSQLW